eukprot:Skav210086  [mRNA]  locus=scaffold1510:184383:186172:+ [translate_table: standard]
MGCTAWNDLRVASELQVGQASGWQVIYPEARIQLAMHSVADVLQVSVRLRDDVKVCGMCTAVQASTLRLSTDFGDFGDRAAQHFLQEALAAHHEIFLRMQRQKEINQQLNEEVSRAILRRQKWVMLSLSVCLLILLGGMVACAVVSFSLATELQGVGLAMALLGLCGSAGCGCATLFFAAGGAAGANWEMRQEVRAVRPDLRRFEDTGVGGANDWRTLMAWSCFWCVPLVVLGCVAAMTVASSLNGYDWVHAAVHTIHEHTIVFEGNVLPGRQTVCSWPGKYATAWDTLVAGSKQDDISAAVVFLPEGSTHFGLHDPIPASQDLQDLYGECWCTPLYGERKPWGCRWWSKWIANIEQAASQECTLEVYYFNGMRGKGKVKDFTTAGEEHMRREAIERRKDAFLKSEDFGNALEAGLKHLPKEKGPDSSSPYSREVHRLFLAWLPEEDRQFLASSEGIGNSQKAEVAWLERKGYSYIEREVGELESSSPKAIGRAVTP